jgi:hypothetical protein
MKILRPGTPPSKQVIILRGNCGFCNALVEVTSDELKFKGGTTPSVKCPTEGCKNHILLKPHVTRNNVRPSYLDYDP